MVSQTQLPSGSAINPESLWRRENRVLHDINVIWFQTMNL